MALVATFSHDRALRRRLDAALRPQHGVAEASSWDRLHHLVRERPTTLAVLDLCSIPGARGTHETLVRLQRLFPHLGTVLAVRPGFDPGVLFQVGRTGIRNLVLLEVENLEAELFRALARAASGGTTAGVLRAVSPYLAPRPLRAVHLALEELHRRWSAREFAERVGLSRPFLSECLKASGLPSAGHLLLWARLLHAGQWLEEPGRTGESVSRQLDYSSGAAFRRALKHYTGATPTQVAESGGLAFVLGHFEDACGFKSLAERSVA